MKVKIELQKGETQEYAEEFLLKALKAKQNKTHSEKFSDKGIQAIEKLMMQLQKEEYEKMLKEIEGII